MHSILKSTLKTYSLHFPFFCNALQIKFVQFIYVLEIDWVVISPYLLPDSDVSLLDQDTCMVDGFCKPKLENLGLKTAFKKVVNFQTKNVIELHLILREDSSLNKATEKCISFKQTFGILFLKSEQISGSSTDLCQGELDTPYLPIDIILHINVTRR